jgi:pyruvate kinase
MDDHVIVEDGLCNFTVTKKTDDGTGFLAAALDDFTVAHRKTMNTPGVTIDMPSLIPADLEKLDFVKDMELEYVALSFVRTRVDIEALRAELDKRDMESDIVAKIENQSAIDHLDKIIEVSDAVMVARGDLGVEVPFEQLIYWQKELISRCRQLGKPVITATQMLESMVNDPLPTRAEVSDVAHAVYDGTDAVMLSGETTIGKYPVKTVETQARISHFSERQTNLIYDLDSLELDTTAAAMTDAVIDIIDRTSKEFDKVVILTETGRSAELLSRYRIPIPVHAITSTQLTRNKMALLYGVTPHVVDFDSDEMSSVNYITEMLEEASVVESGERVLLVHGQHWTEPGKISSLTAVKV